MRVLYDITTLGHIHCAPGVSPTGIYNHTEAMGLALNDTLNGRVDFCTAESQYRKAIRYIEDTQKIRLEQFPLSASDTSISSPRLTSALHSSRFEQSSLQTSVHDYFANCYQPSALYNSGEYDIYHVNWRGAETLPKHARAQVFLTVYDLIALKNPDWFVPDGDPNPLGQYLRTLLSSVQAQHSITVSTEAVKKDVLAFFKNIREDQIYVTPLGVSDHFEKVHDRDILQTTRSKYGIPNDARYVLCVNTLEPRKNMSAVIDAFVELQKDAQLSDVYLVLAGSKGWLYEEIIERAKGAGDFGRRIIQAGYVDYQDLPSLYSDASAFCYPSLDEGFGLPVLEAMRCGVPVITSDRPPLKEVVGDAAICVDPKSIDAIAKGLSTVLKNEHVSQGLSTKGERRAKEFSWKKSAQLMQDAYSDSLERRANQVTPNSRSIAGRAPSSTSNSISNYVAPIASQKDRFKGKRVFIVGSGRSVRNTPLHILDSEFTIVTGSNAEYFRSQGGKPDYVVIEHLGERKEHAVSLNSITGSHLFVHRDNKTQIREGADVSYFGRREGSATVGSDPENADLELSGPSSEVNAAIQLAEHLGFQQIYLVGTNTLEEALSQSVSAATDNLQSFEHQIKQWHTANRTKFEQLDREIFDTDIGPHPRIYARKDLHSVLATKVLKDFERDAHMTLDETQVISTLFPDDKTLRIMLDVGAHRGHSAKHFVNRNWRVHCFEPDIDNRENHLRKKFGDRSNLTIDPRAVSDQPNEGVAFFTSEESSGISGLHAFRESHEKSNTVQVTTIEHIVEEYKISKIDFLKIDVEGFDFSVLKGVPWDRIKPEVIECEYEDYKTVPMGHTWQDIADYLRARGYTVYVSEWHPIIRYGVAHDWRRVTAYPGIDIPSNSWGNLLAFREDPGIEKLQSAFSKSAKRHTAPKASKSQNVAPPQKTATPQTKVKRPEIQPAAAQIQPKAAQPALKRPFYAEFGEKILRRSPRLFSVLQILRRASVGVLKRVYFWVPSLIVLIGLIAISFQPQMETHRATILLMTAVIGIFLGLCYVAFRAYRSAATLSQQLQQLHQHQVNASRENLAKATNQFSNVQTDHRRMNMLLARLESRQRAAEQSTKQTIGNLEKKQSHSADRQSLLEESFKRSALDIKQAISRDLDRQSRHLEQQRKDLEQQRKDLAQQSKDLEELNRVLSEISETIDTQNNKVVEFEQEFGARIDAVLASNDDLKSTLQLEVLSTEKALSQSLEQDVAKAKQHIREEIDGTINRVSQLATEAEKLDTAHQSTRHKLNKVAFSTGLISERLSKNEQQIGQLLYPDPPNVIVFFGHHKCASRFFRNHVFGQVAETTGANVRRYEIKDPPFHYSRADDLDMCNIDFSELGEHGREIVLFANASSRSLDKINRTAGDDWRGIRVLRDPRQVLVSNYFHHKGDHIAESHEAGWVWDQLVQDKPLLNELSIEDGLMYELNNISKDILDNQLFGSFDDDKVLTIKLEEFRETPSAHLATISEFLQVPTIAGINFEATYSNPQSRPWRQVFTTLIRDTFKERYGQALIDAGYAKDFDW
ncbi:MAG: FkbM family methyltransferase [Hyphomonadaceae bacterium]|nr:FkbM family methyltransferase [Hyphomonadaceae bacterium]